MKSKTKLNLTDSLYQNLSVGQVILLVMRLSVPAILAQISSIVMQYIDSAMVGSLGANATASIGLVSTSTWLIGGLTGAVSAGFSVQVAQFIGAKRNREAADVFRQSLIIAGIFGTGLALCGAVISFYLPSWLGGALEIRGDATKYFMIYSLALFFVQMRQLMGAMLQSTGDMKTPSILNTLMCGLDVIFNFLLIFPSRDINLGGLHFHIIGANMGVAGAALGTAFSELVTALIMAYIVCVKSKILKLKRGESWKIHKPCLKTVAKIASPIALEHIATCGAHIASTKIIVPLGTVSIAAHSLAITAESFCYMPGYGIGSAATTLVGQSIGAGNKHLSKKFAWVAVGLGVAFMTLMGIIMYFAAPAMMGVLTPVTEVRDLGATMLRIEAFAEPLYALSIVASGALRGAGDTFVPGIMNLGSMWLVRIVSAAILAPVLGLQGVWIAMCGELCVRGILFFIRLLRGKWLKIKVIEG